MIQLTRKQKSKTMKLKISFLALSLVIAGSFISCKKDSQAPSGPSTLKLQLQAVNKSFSLPVSGLKSGQTSLASVNWDTATMLVSRIKFEAEMKSVVSGHDSVEIEYSWRGPLSVNLFDLSSTVGSITLPAGTYEKIALRVNSEKEDAANGQPLFYLSGTYTNTTGGSLPLVISVSDPISFKAVQESDTLISGGVNDFTSTIQFYLDQMLFQVDPVLLDNATLSNGILLISAESNKQLYRMILHNLLRDHHCRLEHHHRS
jgi:hypothetical protein